MAEYHNRISIYHSGMYPMKPPSQTIQRFQDEVANGKLRLYACFDGQRIVGFCKIDIHEKEGILEYLFVNQAYRR